MKTQVDLAPNPDLRRAFTRVANLIANPSPLWLIDGLVHFSGFVGGDAMTRGQEKDLLAKMALAHDAADRLIKFLSAYTRLPLGIRCPDDVAVALHVLPRIRDEFALRMNMPRRAGGQKPNTPRKTCAAVVIEAWRIVHGKPKPESDEVWTACNEYWQACGREYRGSDVDTWREDCRDAVADNHEWIRQIFLAYKTGRN